ncbi:MAG: hypothetical protein LBM71_03865 [Elusimicrobiota bacterium]|jgi:cell division protein FtsL|nr:hypothetical protein [Elusimicrobiota bacterium]
MRTLYLILAIGIFLLLLSMERVQKEKTGHQVAMLMEDLAFKEARNQYLRYKIGIYKSPAKIMEAAVEKGLLLTPPQNIIVIEEINDSKR